LVIRGNSKRGWRRGIALSLPDTNEASFFNAMASMMRQNMLGARKKAGDDPASMQSLW
jgi:hypothetical protein